MTRLPRTAGLELIAGLQRIGFSVVRVRGSHHFLRHPDGRQSFPVMPARPSAQDSSGRSSATATSPSSSWRTNPSAPALTGESCDATSGLACKCRRSVTRSKRPALRHAGGSNPAPDVQVLSPQPYGPQRKARWPYKWKGPPGLPRRPSCGCGGTRSFGAA
jgi:predicted RNA binding protein YcfA (HicA-like mRNA interferase family)